MTTARRVMGLLQVALVGAAICTPSSAEAICTRSEGPQKIVVLFDGTWNNVTTNTNILRLRDEVERVKSTSGGIHALYDAGPGSDWRRLSGGGLGYGVARNARQGYTFIAECYQPGDQIFIFGFSRGAFTARTLAAMIQQVGILNHRAFLEPSPAGGQRLDSSAFRNAVETAYKIEKKAGKEAYKSRTGTTRHTPSDLWSHLSAKQAIAKLKASRPKGAQGEPVLFPASIEVVGVWETVGALGFSQTKVESLYLVDLADLPSVRRAYQALSLDENRPSFWPVLWGAPSAAAPTQVVQEVWFPGAHSDVGGGYAGPSVVFGTSNLADLSLSWMADKLRGDGLVRSDFAVLSADQARTLGLAKRHIEKQPLAKSLNPRSPSPGSLIHGSACDRMGASGDGVEGAAAKAQYRPAGLFTDGGASREDLRFLGWDGRPGSCAVGSR